MISSATLLALLAAAATSVSGSPMPSPSMMEPTKTMSDMKATKMAESMMAEASMTSSAMVEAASSTSSSMMMQMSMSMSSMMAEQTQYSSSNYGSSGSSGYDSGSSNNYGGSSGYGSSSGSGYGSSSSPQYGSGSSNWGQSPLDQCLLQCAQQFGGDSSYMGGTGTSTSSSATATHTVIVAPTKGVLRYVPFSVNASVGDVVEYVWGAGPHTVTQSNAFNVCNKSLATNAFTSGLQNATATFQVPVTSLEPVFEYCTVPGHCAKGMFGVINPPNTSAGSQNATTAAATNVAAIMSTWSANSPANAATLAAVQSMPGMTADIMNWGMDIDVSSIMGQVDMATVCENVLYTQMTYAMNPGMMEGGSVSVATMNIPPDVSSLASSGATPSTLAGYGQSGAHTSTPATAQAAEASASASTTSTPSGARALIAPMLTAFGAVVFAACLTI